MILLRKHGEYIMLLSLLELVASECFKSKKVPNVGLVSDIDSTVVVVVGSCATVVEAVAVRLASSGSKVLVSVFGAPEISNEISKKINGMGHEALAFTGDVITLADATSMVHEAVKAWGTVDLLVNVAGMAPHTTLPVEATPLSKWQEVIHKNLTTFYNCIEAASSIMTGQRKGRIITVCDLSVIGVPGQTRYGAAAAGIIGLTRSAASEKSKANKIAVNVVTPYGVGTNVAEQTLEAIPLGKFDKLDQITDMVEFLAFDVLGGALTGLLRKHGEYIMLLSLLELVASECFKSKKVPNVGPVSDIDSTVVVVVVGSCATVVEAVAVRLASSGSKVRARYSSMFSVHQKNLMKFLARSRYGPRGIGLYRRHHHSCRCHFNGTRQRVPLIGKRSTSWATRHCPLQATSLFFIILLQWFASMVRKAFQAWGTIDILANVAGMAPETTLFVETLLSQWQEVIEKNLTSYTNRSCGLHGFHELSVF